MLKEALSYPRRDDSWRTVVIGGLLTFFWWVFLVPLFVVFGYIVHVLQSSVLGEAKAPPFDDWSKLVVDGLKAVAISLAYLFIPLLIVVVGLSGTIVGGQGMNGGGTARAILPLLLVLVGGVLMVIVAAIVPVALTNFALEDRLGAGFEVRKIIDAATTGDYIKAVLYSIFIGIGGVVAFRVVSAGFLLLLGLGYRAVIVDPRPGALETIDVIFVFISYLGGVVVASFVGLYMLVAIYHLLGQGCAPALVDDSSASRTLMAS